MEKLKDFMRISEAADYLGVSPNTLRNWANAGKIAAHRHLVNGYRLFGSWWARKRIRIFLRSKLFPLCLVWFVNN